jgi:hypothetical protein
MSVAGWNFMLFNTHAAPEGAPDWDDFGIAEAMPRYESCAVSILFHRAVTCGAISV